MVYKRKNYLNWKGEKVTNCDKGEGYCNKPDHYTTAQHEAALRSNQHLMSQLPEEFTVEQVDSDGDGYVSYKDYLDARPDNIAFEGVYRDYKKLEEIPIPKKQHYKIFIEGAVENGFKVFKPQHVYENDNSVQLEKRIDELNGKIMIRLTDRKDRMPENMRKENGAAQMHVTMMDAWFVGDAPAGYANSEHALNFTDGTPDSTTAFNNEKVMAAVGTCDGCGRNVGRNNLIHVAFANNFCQDCAPSAKEEMEKPGWYN